MPLYDYHCERCGPFTAMRPMARFQDACPCPGCAADASRTWLGAPAIGRHDAGGGRGRDAEPPRAADPQRASTAHPVGCGCCVRRVPLPATLGNAGRVFRSHGPVAGHGS